MTIIRANTADVGRTRPMVCYFDVKRCRTCSHTIMQSFMVFNPKPQIVELKIKFSPFFGNYDLINWWRWQNKVMWHPCIDFKQCKTSWCASVPSFMISEQEFREGNGLILSPPLSIKKPGFSSIKDALSHLKQFLATMKAL